MFELAEKGLFCYNSFMKANVHPKYNQEAQVICVCGNRFTTGSTMDVIHVELCYKCHPFYTGEQKFVDSASRIQKFQKKQQVAETKKAEHVSPLIKGAGGGQKTLATAGGQDASNLQKVIDTVKGLIK